MKIRSLRVYIYIYIVYIWWNWSMKTDTYDIVSLFCNKHAFWLHIHNTISFYLYLWENSLLRVPYPRHYQNTRSFLLLRNKRQISTKLIGENMFCMKAHQLSIVLPSKSRLVQLRIHTSYTKTCFFLGVTCYFSRITYFWSFVLFRCYDFIRSLYYFWTIPKTLIAQHYFCLIYIEI